MPPYPAPRSKPCLSFLASLDRASGRGADGGYRARAADRCQGAGHLRGLDAPRGPRGPEMVREIVDGHDALHEAPRLDHQDPIDLLRWHPVLCHPELVAAPARDQ